MDLERLKEAYRRAYAADARTVLPRPLREAWLLVDGPATAPSVGAVPVSFQLRARNIGAEDCLLQRVVARPAGVTVSAPSNVVLGAQTPAASALVLEATLHPFSLDADCREALFEFHFTVPDAAAPRVVTRAVPFHLDRPKGPALVLECARFDFDRLAVQDLRLFAVQAPGAREVLLRIEDGPNGKAQYPMTARDGACFRVAIPLSKPGHYAYRFSINGKCRPDDEVADLDHSVANLDTACTPLEVTDANRRVLRLRNRGSEALSIKVEAKADWLGVGFDSIEIQPGGQAELPITVRTAQLAAGTYQDQIALRTNMAGRVEVVPVRAVVRAPGPVPYLRTKVCELGTLHFGVEKRASVELFNLGDLVLKGRLDSDGDSWITPADFELPPSARPQQVNFVVYPHGEPLRQAVNRESRVILNTNSDVFGPQGLSVVVHYRVDALRFDPPEIDFGEISPEQTLDRTVRVVSGEDQPVTVPLEVVGKLPDWMRIKESKEGRLTIALTGPVLNEEKQLEWKLQFFEPASGLGEVLPVRGRLVVPRAQAGKLKFGLVRMGQPERKPLPLYNVGKGTLLIKQVIFDQLWLKVEESSDASHPLDVVVDFNEEHATERRGPRQAVIEVETNDLKRPKVEIRVLVELPRP
jgi:hypothetical protein